MNQSLPEEKWIRWEPIKGLSPKYFVDTIIDNIKEFSILLIDEFNEKNTPK